MVLYHDIDFLEFQKYRAKSRASFSDKSGSFQIFGRQETSNNS